LIEGIEVHELDMFVFQQDNAPAHRDRFTVELMRCKTPQLISPDT